MSVVNPQSPFLVFTIVFVRIAAERKIQLDDLHGTERLGSDKAKLKIEFDDLNPAVKPKKKKRKKKISNPADKPLCAIKAAGFEFETSEACRKQLGDVCSCECACWNAEAATCQSYETNSAFKCSRDQKIQCAAETEWQKAEKYLFDPQVVGKEFAKAKGIVFVKSNKKRMFRVNVKELLFSQMQGSYKFSASRTKQKYTIATTLCSFVRGELDPNDKQILSPLDVVAFKVGSSAEHRLMSLSNRRLIALQLFAQYYPERVTELYKTQGLYVNVNLASSATFEDQSRNIHPMCNQCGSCIPGREFRDIVVFHMGVQFPVSMLFGAPGSLRTDFDAMMEGKKCSEVKSALDHATKKGDLIQILKSRQGQLQAIRPKQMHLYLNVSKGN